MKTGPFQSWFFVSLLQIHIVVSVECTYYLWVTLPVVYSSWVNKIMEFQFLFLNNLLEAEYC